MTLKNFFSCLLFCFCFIVTAVPVSLGQTKVERSGTFWPEIQAEYVFKNTSFLYLRNQYRHNFDQDFNRMRDSGPLKYIERVQLRAGYEHVFNSKWNGGIAGAYGIDRIRRILFNEVFVRHSSTLGAYQFTKRLSGEHIVQWGRENFGRVRFRTDLDRTFSLGSLRVRPRVSYELFFNQDYTPDPVTDINRRVDRTRLRFEMLFGLNNYVAIIPSFIRQTDYLLVLPSYDGNNNIVRSGGKQNLIVPIIGLDVRVTFFKGGKAFSRAPVKSK